jgi:hypothetical protein
MGAATSTPKQPPLTQSMNGSSNAVPMMTTPVKPRNRGNVAATPGANAYGQQVSGSGNAATPGSVSAGGRRKTVRKGKASRKARKGGKGRKASKGRK